MERARKLIMINKIKKKALLIRYSAFSQKKRKMNKALTSKKVLKFYKQILDNLKS